MRSKKMGTDYYRVVAAMILFAVLCIVTGGKREQKFFLPLFHYAMPDETGRISLLHNSLEAVLPLYEYHTVIIEDEEADLTAMEALIEADEEITLNILESEGDEGSRPENKLTQSDIFENVSISGNMLQSASGEGTAEAQQALQELMLQENQVGVFMPAAKVATYDLTMYEDYENLLSNFYTIDRYALAGSDLFNVHNLMEKDLSIDKETEGPQILIYHTHSKEAFADSVPGDTSQTIVGVGAFLTKILAEQYGYTVLHYTEEFDAVRDDAYANSLPELERILEENPSIQVVIDLHRDAANPARENVMEINGKRVARFMFFNGISRSKQNGNIDYLYNPNLEGNLAFSFQMQKVAGEYYPGLTRKIYVKQYRYNMHLRERSLLVEMGDNTNTVEEAMNACYPLAHILHTVLSGD